MVNFIGSFCPRQFLWDFLRTRKIYLFLKFYDLFKVQFRRMFMTAIDFLMVHFRRTQKIEGNCVQWLYGIQLLWNLHIIICLLRSKMYRNFQEKEELTSGTITAIPFAFLICRIPSNADDVFLSILHLRKRSIQALRICMQILLFFKRDEIERIADFKGDNAQVDLTLIASQIVCFGHIYNKVELQKKDFFCFARNLLIYWTKSTKRP